MITRSFCTFLSLFLLTQLHVGEVLAEQNYICLPINVETEGDTFLTLISEKEVIGRSNAKILQSEIGRYACSAFEYEKSDERLTAILSITNSSGIKRVWQTDLSEDFIQGEKGGVIKDSDFQKYSEQRDRLLKQVGSLKSDLALIGGVDRVRTVERDIEDARKYLSQLDSQLASIKKSLEQARKMRDSDVTAAQETQLSKDVSDLTRMVHEAKSKKSPNYTVQQYISVYNNTSSSDVYSLRERIYQLKQRLASIRG